MGAAIFETGEIAAWANKIIADLDTYAEISPSGTGVKLFAQGTLPAGFRKKWKVTDAPKICDKTPAIEIYDRGRYFCVTGWRLDGQSEPQERQAELEVLLASYRPQQQTAPQHPAQNGQHAPSSEPSVAERARHYLRRVPGAVSGQFGHDATFAAACVLVIDFNLSPDEAWPIFAEWNQTCNPPWSDCDLRRKLDEANKQSGERGSKLVNDKTTNGRSPKANSPFPFLLRKPPTRIWICIIKPMVWVMIQALRAAAPDLAR